MSDAPTIENGKPIWIPVGALDVGVGRSPGASINTGGDVGGTSVGWTLGSLVTGAAVGSIIAVGLLVGGLEGETVGEFVASGRDGATVTTTGANEGDDVGNGVVGTGMAEGAALVSMKIGVPFMSADHQKTPRKHDFAE